MDKKGAKKSVKFDLKFNPKRDTVTLLIIVASCFVQAFAIVGFYVPHGFLSGGVTGVSLLIKYLFEIPSWVLIVVLNIPIVIIGFRYLHPKFVIFSIIGTVVFSAAIALAEGFEIKIENEILAALAGGTIVGVCGAPVVRRDATLGGMDVIAAIIGKRFSIPMGTVNIIFNSVIMVVLGIMRGIEIALISMLAMFVSNLAFNFMLVGLNRTVTVLIISDEWESIAPDVIKIMNRGVTYIPAEGAYTGNKKKIVYCIVKTAELATLRRIVRSLDENAMISVIETKEVVGRGFGAMN